MSCAQTYARREHELLLENRRNLQLPNGDIQSRASSSYIVSLTVARRSTRSRVGRVLAFLGGCPVPPRLNMRLALSTSRYSCFSFVLPLVIGHCFGPNSCALHTAVLLLPVPTCPPGFGSPGKFFYPARRRQFARKSFLRSPRKSTP